MIDKSLGRGIPCAAVIGGGYDNDVDVLSRRHSIIHRAALKVTPVTLSQIIVIVIKCLYLEPIETGGSQGA